MLTDQHHEKVEIELFYASTSLAGPHSTFCFVSFICGGTNKSVLSEVHGGGYSKGRLRL